MLFKLCPVLHSKTGDLKDLLLRKISSWQAIRLKMISGFVNKLWIKKPITILEITKIFLIGRSKACHDAFSLGTENTSSRAKNWSLNHRRPKLTSREKANDEFMNASRVVWLGVKLREEPLKIWTCYKE